jgi:hypothetical protein
VSAFESAIGAGLKMIRRTAGVSVTVTRGATTITVSDAVQGQSQKQIIDETAETVVEGCDWLISVASYTLGQPAVGDIISRKVNGITYYWTVESPVIGISHFDWSDTARTTYRIRARKDGAAAFEIVQPNGFDLSGSEMRYA